MSGNTTNISIRMDAELKSQADALFAELGMNLSTAFNIFVRQSLREGGIPFAVKLDQPNKETIAAMLEAERIAKDPSVKGYDKNAGKIFSNTPIINRRIAITDIPIPIVLHSFFSLYFAFSSLEAVLYPEINQLPCPEIKTMESTANIINPTYTTQSGPVDKSASFICITPPTKFRLSFSFMPFNKQESKKNQP